MTDLLATAPADDSGAQTADRYHFQYCCAGARLLAAITEGVDRKIVCELHEDFLVLDRTETEAVSVKHREDHLAAWTISSLVSDGGIARLLSTFAAAPDLHCRFESNKGHNVADLWSQDSERRTQMREDLRERLSVDSQLVDGFVDRLEITEPAVPSRHHIESAWAGQYAAPALDELGLSLDPAAAVKLVCQLVADASRGTLSPEARTTFLAAPPSQRSSLLASHQLAARLVSTDEVVEALRAAESAGVPRLAGPAGVVPAETSLTKKLERGGLGPSVVSTAQKRRSMWYSHVARSRDIRAREAELRSLEEWVQDQANAAEIATQLPDTTYGPAMYQHLLGALRSSPPPAGTRSEDSDPALLTGAAFELTDQCSIWWSRTFDVDEDVA